MTPSKNKLINADRLGLTMLGLFLFLVLVEGQIFALLLLIGGSIAGIKLLNYYMEGTGLGQTNSGTLNYVPRNVEPKKKVKIPAPLQKKLESRKIK